MIVIATVITSHFTVDATDSFITVPKSDGTFEIEKPEETKIVPVLAWRGALSYWGPATHNISPKTFGRIVAADDRMNRDTTCRSTRPLLCHCNGEACTV